MSGHMQEGVDTLSKYADSKFSDWWPIWYYMGVAHQAMGMNREAKEDYLKVLKLSPSNTETMKELVKIYEAEGDEEKAEKYRKKISIVAENVEKDRLLAMEEKNKKLS